MSNNDFASVFWAEGPSYQLREQKNKDFSWESKRRLCNLPSNKKWHLFTHSLKLHSWEISSRFDLTFSCQWESSLHSVLLERLYSLFHTPFASLVNQDMKQKIAFFQLRVQYHHSYFKFQFLQIIFFFFLYRRGKNQSFLLDNKLVVQGVHLYVCLLDVVEETKLHPHSITFSTPWVFAKAYEWALTLQVSPFYFFFSPSLPSLSPPAFLFISSEWMLTALSQKN